MVGNDSVVLETECPRRPIANEGAEIIAGRARPAGDLLRDFLRVFELSVVRDFETGGILI
jgi:hypothetical protein